MSFFNLSQIDRQEYLWARNRGEFGIIAEEAFCKKLKSLNKIRNFVAGYKITKKFKEAKKAFWY